jgi:hypothetical protein
MSQFAPCYIDHPDTVFSMVTGTGNRLRLVKCGHHRHGKRDVFDKWSGDVTYGHRSFTAKIYTDMIDGFEPRN